MKKPAIFLALFLLVCGMEIAGLLLHISVLHTVAKPLIVIFLAGYYAASVSHHSGVFLLALFFCWTGDVLLQLQEFDNLFFMGGLLAFLTGHIFYIIAYRKHRDLTLPSRSLYFKIAVSIPVVLIGFLLVVFLYPDLGGLRVPVMLYALVLVLMVEFAIFRMGRVPSNSFWLVMSGALFFMVSDSLLAINKFHSPVPYGNVLVMTTYITAQFLIAEGIIKFKVKA